MKKMKLETSDLSGLYTKRVGGVLPEVVTEIKGKDGKLKKAVDFEKLKALLTEADEIAEPDDEKYEFTWVGKKEAMLEANKPIRKTLRPCKEESKDWDNTENLYIEGDNLEVIKLLQESYLNKIKMIYIDPPYNTGNDFIYNDDFKMDSDEYKDETGEVDEEGNRLFKNTDTNGRFHSDWCSMMYSRLILARNLLSEDGAIFISIDYNENYNMRNICNEVFGKDNFVGEIYWESKTKSQNTKTSYNKLQPKAEMIFVYDKGNKRRFNLIKIGEKEYPLKDSKGVYREHQLEVMNANGIRGRETMIFNISDGVSNVFPPDGKQWKIGQDQISQYKEQGDLFIKNDKVIIKMRPEFERTEKTEPFWGFFDKSIGTAESGKKEVKDIMGDVGFETVKPIELIKRIVYHTTSEQDTIFDFFSGSATTAHAVMDLNAEDGGNRKFIMVQLPEECDEKSAAYKAGYKNICEIGKERIRRAGEKIKEDNADKEGIENLDTGFRVLKVDDTNMKDVYYTPDKYSQRNLFDLESNIKEDRTELDLLYGCLIDWGLPLNRSYESNEIEGSMVHIYNDGDLIACFDEDITEEAIKKIAKMEPLRAVFRDSSFKTSSEKINVEEIFKLLSPETSVRVL